jgi:hypothetical protein
MSDRLDEQIRSAYSLVPEPPDAVTAQSEARVLSALEPERPTSRRRGAMLTLAAAACVFVGIAIGASITTRGSQAATSDALGFIPSAGWNVISTGAIPLSAGPAAVATNGPYQREDVPAGSFPQETIAHLTPNRIVIFAQARPRGRFANVDAGFPRRKLPLRLSDARILRGWEMQPNTRIPEYRMLAATGKVNLDVRVYFGTQHPSPAILADAQSELARLRVPSM